RVAGRGVGDAAQFTTAIGVTQRVGDILSFDVDYRFVDGLYADYSIAASDFLQPDNAGALKLPSYGLVDLGVTADFGPVTARVNVNNVFDVVYIAESNTNIHATDGSETWKTAPIGTVRNISGAHFS
ncbi:MAG: TonB-dependent receptor, partial [Opitutae bacterium]|nr:TonB-dependent receptor [Opitutae bacterium]